MKKSNKLLNIIIGLSLVIVLSATCFTGCGGKVKVNVVEPYICETETYTSLDYNYADEYFKKTYFNWGGGCSAIVKKLDDRIIVGRNMDLNISNKCSYVVKTDVKGNYKTIGLAYTFRDISPEYSQVKQSGIDEQFSKLLPFMCDDVMNEKGLYVEINMRNAEFWPGGQDKFACSGTNPNASRSIYMFELPRYLAEHCKNVTEAIDFVLDTNIYSKNGYWNYCFMLADAEGNYGLLEFAMNKVFWQPFAVGQTNYYINEEMASIQNTKTGEGRMKTLLEGIDNVKNKQDMFNLMDSVSYFQFYDPYNAKFDPRSENIGTLAGLTYDFVMNEEIRDVVFAFMDAYGKPIREKSRAELQNKNEYWESTFTLVSDCKDKSILVRFYENNSLIFNLTFDSFVKAN